MLKPIQKATTDSVTWWSAPALKNFLLSLLVFILPTQLGLHFWPDWAFINGLRIDYFSPTIYLSDVIITILVILETRPSGAIGSFFRTLSLRSSVTIKIIVVVILSNIYFSLLPTLTIYKWFKILEFFLLGVILCKSFPKNFVTIFSWSMMLQSFLAIYQFIFQKSFNGIFYFLGERSFSSATSGIAQTFLNNQLLLRPYGTLPHPNVLAAFLLIAVILNKNLFFRIFFSLIICLTFSKTSLVILLFLGFMFGVSKIFQKNFLQMKTRNSLVDTVFLVFLFSEIFLGMFWPTLNLNVNLSGEILIREKLIYSTMESFSKYFWAGTGLGTNVLINNQNNFYTAWQPLSYLQPVHNFFWLFLSELGLPVFLFFIFLLIKFLNKLKLPEKILVFVFITLGSFDHYFVTTQQGQLMSVFLIVLVIINRWRNSNKSVKTLPSKFLVKG